MILFNEGYNKNSELYLKGKGSIVYSKKKSYIDLSCGAGTLLLGHNSKIRVQSIKSYLKKGLSQFSHPNKSAVDLSKRLKKVFPKFHKFILCNTGAEANIKALRVARAATGKNLVINVNGSWHGSVDQFLFNIKNNYNFYEDNDKNNITSLSDGIDPKLTNNLKYIPFNNIELSKKILDKNKRKICCVLIEPIQGGFPSPQSKKYLQFLNDYCKKNNIILFFDEILSGIRVNGSSVQNIFNIKTGISTFGKIIGGGMPIGLIGISREVYSKIKKKNKRVFFGGTYSGNSLSTYVGKRTLEYILKNKKKIFGHIEKQSEKFVSKLNEFVKKNNMDVQVIRFHSIIRIIFSSKKIKDRPQRDFLEKSKSIQRQKFIKYLKKQGIFFPGNGIIFFNYSLKNSELNYLIKKFEVGFKKYF